MVGFAEGYNPTPTLYVEDTKIGINTKNPEVNLQLNEGIGRIMLGTSYDEATENDGNGIGFLGFNLAKTSDEAWTTSNDDNYSGGSLISGTVDGSLYFVTIPSNGGMPQTFTGADIREQTKLSISSTGKVSMGITNFGTADYLSTAIGGNGYRLYVADGIRTEKVRVDVKDVWADYVFEEEYERNSIEEVADFVKENKHLPNVPSAEEVENNGIDVANMDATLLRQIEELWLHTMDMNEELKSLKRENEQLKHELELLKTQND